MWEMKNKYLPQTLNLVTFAKNINDAKLFCLIVDLEYLSVLITSLIQIS